MATLFSIQNPSGWFFYKSEHAWWPGGLIKQNPFLISLFKILSTAVITPYAAILDILKEYILK